MNAGHLTMRVVIPTAPIEYVTLEQGVYTVQPMRNRFYKIATRESSNSIAAARLRRRVTIGDLATALNISREWAWDFECLSPVMSARENLAFLRLIDEIAQTTREPETGALCTCRVAICTHWQAIDHAQRHGYCESLPAPDPRLVSIASELCDEALQSQCL